MDAEVTHSAGTPTDPEGGGPESSTETGGGRRPQWPRWVALAGSVVVLAAAGVGWTAYQKLEGNITTDTGTAAELKRYEKQRPAPMAHDAQNILLIGSDSRSDKNAEYGRDTGTQRSDTTILLHLAADRESATAVSIPRDLMAEVPSCRGAGGERTRAQFTQFNTAFELGGPACTIRTVENLTGIRVDHHMIVDFTGFKKMVNAVQGVEVCLKEPINDEEAHLELPAGRQKLDGEDALGFVRARYSIGNGSDTERMDRQQQFLGSLVKKVRSNGVLLNPARLYPLLDAATSSVTTDAGLDSLRELYDLVRSVRHIPTEKVQFLTVPRRAYSLNANRDELVQPAASQLFNLLRNDLPVTVRTGAGKDEEAGRTGRADEAEYGPSAMTGREKPDAAVPNPSTSPSTGPDSGPSGEPSEPSGESPTYRGTTAANGMCS
ncbi:LCP family protein [Streptomyces pathocidini]|uniref:LCP family protein n=1 Tax=Streptomyces pathocidini TaxID=1650571 RepID=UPI0033FC11E3